MANDPDNGGQESPAKPSESRGGGALSTAVRWVLPVAIIALGWLIFDLLSVPEEREKKPPGVPQLPKTKVVKLEVIDFEPIVETSGIITAHNEVSLTARVSGSISAIHPHFEDGAFFEEGTILVELDDADYRVAAASAKAQLAQAEAVLAQEDARSKQAAINWRELYADAEPGELVLRLPQLREAEARVDAAKAGLDQANRDLDRTKIRAPFSGRVRQRVVGLSQVINSGTPLGTIFADDYAEVRLPIAGHQMRFLKVPEDPGDKPLPVVLRDALDEANDTEWPATIVRTEGALDADSLELFAIARIEDPFGRRSELATLRIGQPVIARIPGRKLEKVFAVPREAVRQLSRITLVDPEEHTVSKRTISPLWSDDTHLIIRDETIPDGVLLATANLTYTPEGSTVEIIASPDEVSEDPAKEIAGGGGENSTGESQ